MHWRLLLDGAGSGAINMATDECLFEAAISGEPPPTVRLYSWETPTVSIGYRQRWHDVCDVTACRRYGIDLVRRVTGGRALLHHEELTYAVAAPACGPFAGVSVRQVYAWVSGVLRDALREERVRVDPPPGERPGADRAPLDLPCLAVPTGHEITAGGSKLVASAQKWHRRGFLQHGSILLGVDEDRWREIAGSVSSFPLAAVGLRDLDPGWTGERLRAAVSRAFGRRFGGPPRGRLSEREKQRISDLVATKYASCDWARPATGASETREASPEGLDPGASSSSGLRHGGLRSS